MLCLGGGFGLSFVIALYIYLKLCNSEEELASQAAFAKLLLSWGELVLIFVISVLATRINDKESEIRYLMNQMFKYHRHQVTPWLKERGIMLDANHKKSVKAGEAIILGSGYGSFIFPFVLLAMFFHPLEPIHNIALEWLEWELSLHTITWSHAVFFPVIMVAGSAAANTIIAIANLITCYFLIATLALGDMMPVAVAKVKSRNNVTLQTSFYGVLSDEEIIKKFRYQQLLNLLVNHVVANVRISMQHVAMLTAACTMACFAVKYTSVVVEAGVVGYIIVGTFFMVPVLIEYLEASYFGSIVQLSQELKQKCDKLVGRRMLMKVFSRSCVTLYVKEAYPFFNITKDHFLAFMSEVVDKTITLLLW